jgi:hypothetical protein
MRNSSGFGDGSSSQLGGPEGLFQAFHRSLRYVGGTFLQEETPPFRAGLSLFWDSYLFWPPSRKSFQWTSESHLNGHENTRDGRLSANPTTSRHNQKHPVVAPHLSHFIQVPMRTNANLSRLLRILASQRLALDPHSRNLYVLKDLSVAVVAVCKRSYSDVEVDCQEWLARKMWTQSSVLQVLEDRAVSSAICWWP